MRISDWSSDVCSSDLNCGSARPHAHPPLRHGAVRARRSPAPRSPPPRCLRYPRSCCLPKRGGRRRNGPFVRAAKRDRAKVMSTETLIEPPLQDADALIADMRSEEHTSELQSLMRTSYAVV